MKVMKNVTLLNRRIIFWNLRARLQGLATLLFLYDIWFCQLALRSTYFFPSSTSLWKYIFFMNISGLFIISQNQLFLGSSWKGDFSGKKFLMKVVIKILSYLVRLTKNYWIIWEWWLRLVLCLMLIFLFFKWWASHLTINP